MERKWRLQRLVCSKCPSVVRKYNGWQFLFIWKGVYYRKWGVRVRTRWLSRSRACCASRKLSSWATSRRAASARAPCSTSARPPATPVTTPPVSTQCWSKTAMQLPHLMNQAEISSTYSKVTKLMPGVTSLACGRQGS